MSTAAVRVQGVGKRFRLATAQTSFPTLRDALATSTRRAGTMMFSPLRSFRERPRSETFWALRDVSFDVEPGEVVGIIGGNGAGKSTLLKILSRITEPTEGRIEIRGRVGSLLEVGTGFHPELTGRENTFLNGAILGMHRHEVAGKFDEIVAFAEVERFIDTPVKHYSSGMYLRLAFAVAAHLEPEILIVDEVLAVGDAAFQKKCLGKMGDVARQGRTVLFVSHNMDAVQRLCSRCVLLDNGRMTTQGRTAAVVSRYLSRDVGSAGPETWIDLAGARRMGHGAVRFIAAWYSGMDPEVGSFPRTGGPLILRLLVDSTGPRTIESLAFNIRTLGGLILLNADAISLDKPVRLQPGRNSVVFEVDAVHLNPGRYQVGLWASDALGTPADAIDEAFEMDVVGVQQEGAGITPRQNGFVSCRFDVSTAGREQWPDESVNYNSAASNAGPDF
ncbi:MAG TPA: polysaccharide ABC transporter ATP-binding protein [Longimicrobiales bacterium]|nr:polysaccharide ABC transporter ATP-binding protein [Longimicrobiales bacterium]